MYEHQRLGTIPTMPSALSAMSHPLRGFPGFSVARRADNQGQSVGFGHSTMQTALYEYFERRLFSCLGPSSERMMIREIEDEGVRDSIRSALQQTTPPNALSDLEDHRFRVVRAHMLHKKAVIHIPEMFNSLYCHRPDRMFFPRADSSGSALHFSPEQVLESAVLEFLERQCLVVTWLGAVGCMEIKASDLAEHCAPDLMDLIHRLQRCGSIRLIDMSFGTGAFVVLAFFQSRSTSSVPFVCGAAAKLSPYDAINKALKEVWQSHIHHEYRATMSIIHGDDTNLHIDHSGVIEAFTSGVTEDIDIKDYLCQVTVQTSEVIEWIKRVSDRTIFCVAYRSIAGQMYIYGKVINPDFYLNMCTEADNNFHNRFSIRRGVSDSAMIGRAIPF